MCGIVGIFNFRRKGISVSRDILKKMADAISYRGPDQEGYYIDDSIGLGHKRLSIIDLSEKAKQPMRNENGDLWIVYNGEIYNFKDIRKELEAKGHRFRSDSDAEVIIHAYEEYGEKCLQKFNGMFAFAIYDARGNDKKLFLARDRLGKKPLFYYCDDERFVFASELKALLKDKTIKTTLSTEAISYYLTYGYIPAPLSIFKEIKKVMPASFLVVDSNGRINAKQYWEISYKTKKEGEEYYAGRILEELEKATRIRMVSDVPLGAFLSGGIDSSSVVAMMAKSSDDPVKTFSIGFEDGRYDELKFARIVADKFGTDHKEMVINPDMADMLPKIVWYYNEPYADSSALPSYYVANMTRKHVTVALNGDGGDEAFGGYGKYSVDAFVERYSRLPSVAKIAFKAANSMRSMPLAKNINAVQRLGDFYPMTRLSSEDRYKELTFHFNDRAKKDIISEKFTEGDIASPGKFFDKYWGAKGLDLLQRKMYTDVNTFLPYDLLVKMDIATMANSLEGRSPYLDVNLVEFAATIPSNLKVNGTVKKYMLKKALKDTLPKNILHKRKQGFSVPTETWFRKGLKNVTCELLLCDDSMTSGYFRKDKIKELIEQHSRGIKNHKTRLWNLLCLELWHRIYIGNGGKEPKKGISNVR